jgi:hypothetical protein
MKKILTIIFLISVSLDVSAGTIDCGVTSITHLLAGPRHGSMMHVNNSSCGPSGGWVCLDPAGEYIPKNESDRMYAFVMMQYALSKPVQITIYDNVFPAACGGYPLIEDIRSAPQL